MVLHNPRELFCKCGGRYINTNYTSHFHTQKHLKFCKDNNKDIEKIKYDVPIGGSSREQFVVLFDPAIHKRRLSKASIPHKY